MAYFQVEAMIVGKSMKLTGVIHLQKMRTEVEYKIFKISKISIVNDSKQIYTVLSSPNGRKKYEATVCCSPSCTCPDYKKNGKNVLCKHIMFAFLYALRVEQEAFLKQIYISERKL